MSAVQVNTRDTPAVTGPELVQRARALTPLLAAHAAQAEQQRKPVDNVIKAIEDAEIYKFMVPKC